MAAVSEHLERLRAKPHHERRRIALGSSLAITALVAVGWVGGLASSPSLALKDREDGDLGMQGALTDTRGSFSELVGAAGAAFGATSTPAQVTVVDTKARSTLDAPRANHNDTRETVIPF